MCFKYCCLLITLILLFKNSLIRDFIKIYSIFSASIHKYTRIFYTPLVLGEMSIILFYKSFYIEAHRNLKKIMCA